MRVSKPTDPLEREADRLADRVMSMSGNGVHRACACSNDDEEIVSRRSRSATSSGTTVDAGALVPTTGGRSLAPSTRAWADSAFGADFSSVRVHDGSSAARSAGSLDALAYTRADHIVFAAGQYRPDTQPGRHLLAHELVHVLQGSDTVHRDLAVAPTDPDVEPAVLTDEQVADAIAFHRWYSEAEIAELRDVLGITAQPAVIDEDFVRAVARYQASFGLDQDAKIGPVTAAHLSREFRAEARFLGPEGRDLAQEARRLDRRSLVITVTGAARELTQTGSAEYRVQWGVPDRRANGWVIQHVVWDIDKEDCAGTAVAANNPDGLEFWEGWQVRSGRVFVGSSASAHIADTFRSIDEGAGTRGTIRISGRVTFMPDFDLREPPWGHTVAPAGALPTLTVAPPGWSDGFARRHDMTVNWDDCVAPRTHNVIGTP